MGLFDFSSYTPASQYMTPQQQQDAQTMGLLSAASTLADMSAPHPLSQGPSPTWLQLLTGGFKGYGAGTNAYTTGMGTSADSLMKMNQMQGMKEMNDLMAQQYKSVPAQQQSSGQMPVMNGTDASQGNAPTDQTTIPQVNQSALYGPSPTGGSNSPPSLGQFYNQPNSQPTNQNWQPMIDPILASKMQMIAARTGVKLPEGMVPKFSNGWTLGQDGLPHYFAGGEADPNYAGSVEGAKSQGTLPAELAKIGATGAQARQTEGYRASKTPYVQTVMVGDVPYNITTNKLFAATGGLPPGSDGQNVSGSIPVGAKEKYEAIGKTAGENQAVGQSSGDIVDLYKKIQEDAKAAPSGATASTIARATNLVGMPTKAAIAQGTFDADLNNLYLATIRSLKGTGRIMEQELERIQEAAPKSTDSMEVKIAKTNAHMAYYQKRMQELGYNSPLNITGVASVGNNSTDYSHLWSK